MTFLFSDIEGSTELWEQAPEAAGPALLRHDELIEAAVEQHHGVLVRPRGEGDSRFAVFQIASGAVGAAAAIQQVLHAEPWQTPTPLRVRIALHTGEADLRMGDYYGSAVNRCARLRSLAYGGQTLLSNATAELAQDQLPQGVTLRDMGQHRLKDLSRPEQIFQLVIPELSTDFPPLKSLEAHPINLPVQATALIGREKEVAAACELLLSAQGRLLTLTGHGGIGKTRLAIEIATRQNDKFSDGVHFVPLAPLEQPNQIVQTIIETLALSSSSGEEPKVLLLRHLRKKQLLLLLDNFEHLLEGAPVIKEILQAAPKVIILATSREKLNLSGETAFNVPGLDFAAGPTANAALTDSAAQLFIQSAQQVQPGFDPVAEEAASVVKICQLVEGVPLAILLAAAWVDVLSPQEIAAEIVQSLDFLETELRDVPARQRSLRAVFETSWKHLPRIEQELFEALSVFRGGFTRAVAKEVAGASPRGLAGLTNKSFLRRNPDTGRYEIHELLRQYAEEQLDSDPETSSATHAAHAAYYADFMERSWIHMRTHQQKAALLAVEEDIENIRIAWRYWLAQKHFPELLKFLSSFWFVHEIRGWHHAVIELLGAASKQLTPDSGDVDAVVFLARIKADIGHFNSIIGNPEQVSAFVKESIASLRPLNRPAAMLFVLLDEATNNMYLNNPDQVSKSAQELGQLAHELGDRWMEGLSMNYQALSLLIQGRLAEARGVAETSLQIFMEEIGDHMGLSWAALVLGNVVLALGAYEEAQGFYLQSLAAAEVINYRRTIQQCYDNLGDVAFLLDEYEEAEQYFQRSMQISDETGQTREMLGSLFYVAQVWAAQEKKVAAVELLVVVCEHPTSELYLLMRTENTPLREAADRLLAELGHELEPKTYQAAEKRGLELELEGVVAELIERGLDD